MIHFLTTDKHRYTLAAYLDDPAADGVREHIALLDYEGLGRRRTMRPGVYVFTDLDRLTPSGRERATALWEQLRAAGPRVRLLNHPQRCLLRRDLLRLLEASGENRFRARRVNESRHDLRFPVFLRLENDHTGSLTELLETPAGLESALASTARAREGPKSDELLIVEFCDTSDASGVFRKYSAFCIAGRVLPKYLVVSRHWMVKHQEPILTQATVAEEMAYMRTNPHASWVRDVFERAAIDYGRVDYAMLGDRPQLWEINTNPMIGPRPRHKPIAGSPEDDRVVEPARRVFFDAFRDCLLDLDMPSQGSLPVELGAGLGDRLRTLGARLLGRS